MVRIKVVRGREPGGLCRYLLSLEKRAPGREQADPILLSNMFSASADELAEELRFSADLNSRVKKTVCHYQISFPPQENPPLPTKQAIVSDLLAARGHGANCQFFALEHFDRVHRQEVHHLHVVASAVRLDGTWVAGDFEWVALRQVERDLEQAHGLRLCPPKPEREQQNLTTGESRLKERTGGTLPKEKLWQAIDQAAADQPTLPELVTRLKAAGVEVQFHEPDQNHKGKGVSFAINGSKFQGGKLGKAYSLKGLQQHRGVDYVPERDDERLRELNGLSVEECQSRLEPVQQQQAEDLQTQQAKVILDFVQLRLETLRRKNKGHSLRTPDRAYAITRDAKSQLITITDKKSRVILQAKRAGASWDVSTNNVQPEDVQAFTCYQAEREAKEQQRQQQPKLQPKQMARSPQPRGLEL